MYLYFDRFGVLKEIISDRPFRNGDSKRDKIYIYVDSDETPSSAWVKYRLPNGTLTTETEFFTGTKTAFELPTEPVRNLKYFSYDHTYTTQDGEKIGYLGYVITVPTAVLNSSTDSAIIPTENNMVVCQVRFVDSDIASLGAIVFSVETSMGIITDNSINETQYNYLLEKIAEANNNIMVLADITQADLTNVANGKIVYSVAQAQYFVVDSTNINGYTLAESGKGILASERTIPRYRMGVEITNDAPYWIVALTIGSRLSIIQTSDNEYFVIKKGNTYHALSIDGTKYYTRTVDTLSATAQFSTLFTSDYLTEYVAKTNDANKVYGSSENYTIDATGYGQIPKRNEAGGISVPTPTNSTDATNKAYVDDKITEILTKSFINVDTTSYPTLASFLASTGEEGYIYLYPIDTTDLSKGYYQYIWENNSWQYLGSTEIDLSSYATKTYVDGKIVEAKAYTDSGVADAKDYADNDIIDLANAPLDFPTKVFDNNIRLKYQGVYFEKVSQTETTITWSNARLTFDDETSYYTLTNDLIVYNISTTTFTRNTSNGIAVYTKAQIDTLLSAKQNVINSSNKIASDNVNDTSQTNKFVTQAEKEQITTNKNDISTLNGEVDRLDQRIDNLSALGRFLSMWNCATGLPETEPSTIPYSYQAGDYYVVGAVGSVVNFKPTGTSYTGTASSTAETGTVKVNDYYRYDGEGNWVLVSVADRVVTWDSITGKPELYTKSETDALLSPIESDITALETAIANTVGFETISYKGQKTFSQYYEKYGEKPFIIKLNGYSSALPTTDLNNYIVLLHRIDETNVRYDILYSKGYSNGTAIWSNTLSSVLTATTEKIFATKQDTTEFKVLNGTETLTSLASTIVETLHYRDVFTALYNSQIYLVLIDKPFLSGYYIIIGQDGYYRGTDLSQTFATVISGGYTKEYASKEELENEVQKIEDGTTVVGKSKVADNIAPYSDESGALQDEPFISQGTGTNNNVEIVTTGDFCELKSKNGNTIPVIQLCRNPNFNGSGYWDVVNGTLTTNNSIGTYKVTTVSETSYGNRLGVNSGSQVFIKDHIYYLDFTVRSSKAGLIVYLTRVASSNGISATTVSNTWVNSKGVITAGANDQAWLRISNSSALEVNDEIDFKDVYIVDITSWKDSVIADLTTNPSHFSWYYNGDLSYNTGSLVTANGRYLECGQGRNLFNPATITQNKYIDYNTGVETSGNWASHSDYMLVVPNKPIYVRNVFGINSYYCAIFYDKNKQFVGGSSIAGGASASGIINIPSNVQYLIVNFNSSQNVNDIDVSLYYTAEQGGEGYDQYYPYKAPILIDTGTETLYGVEGSRDTKDHSGLITRVRKRYTFTGNENWDWVDAWGAFRCYAITDAKLVDGDTGANTNAIFAGYEEKQQYSSSGNRTNMSFILNSTYHTANTFALINNNYGASDLEAFKSYIAGKTIEYPIATPTTEQGTPYTRYPDINDYSYMLWKDTNNALVTIPQGASIFYPVNYVGTLDDLVSYVGGDVTKLALKSGVVAQEDKSDKITDNAGLDYTIKKAYKMGNMMFLNIRAGNQTGTNISSGTTLMTLDSSIAPMYNGCRFYANVSGTPANIIIDNNQIKLSENIANTAVMSLFISYPIA